MKAQTVLLACCGLALNVLGADNFWTLDSAEQTNWVSDNWSLGEKPSSANPARIPQNDGTSTAWKNANILVNTFEQPGDFSLGEKNYTSNRLEIAKGGVIVNTTFSACKQAYTYAEIVFNGGVMTNDNGTSEKYIAAVSSLKSRLKIVMNDGEWFFGRTRIGYRSPVTIEVNGGRLIHTINSNYQGLYIGDDKDGVGAKAEWKQTGGTVDVGHFRFYNGTASMSGGLFKTLQGLEMCDSFVGTGGEITGASAIFSGRTASFKDMTIDTAGLTLGASSSEGGRYSFDNSTVSTTGNSTFNNAQIVVTNSTVTIPANANFCSYVTGDNVKTSTLDIASGTLTFKQMYLNDQPAKNQLGPVIIRQTGGTVKVSGTNPLFYTCTLSPSMPFVYEISGGTCTMPGFSAGSNSATNGIIVRVVGNKGKLSFGSSYPQASDQVPPPFHENVIADGEISRVEQTNYSYWYFMCALRPQGGLQMTTNTVFDQLYKKPQSDPDKAVYMDRCRWGEGLFMTNGTGTAATIGTNVAAKWAFDPVADITSTMTAADGGFTSAAGVPWGWYDLPPVRTNTLKRALVSLTLEPKAKTFAQLEDGFREAGYKVAATDAATGRVTLELPIRRLGNRATDRRLFFDFTEYRTPRDIYEGHRTTNAVVKAISYTQEKLGLILLVR